jgi:hypothetical protein
MFMHEVYRAGSSSTSSTVVEQAHDIGRIRRGVKRSPIPWPEDDP